MACTSYFFRRIDLPLELIADRLIADLDDYREQEDGEARRELAIGYREAYRAGRDPAPIVVVCEGGWDLLDGYHRAAGARAAGRRSIAAFELLPED